MNKGRAVSVRFCFGRCTVKTSCNASLIFPARARAHTLSPLLSSLSLFSRVSRFRSPVTYCSRVLLQTRRPGSGLCCSVSSAATRHSCCMASSAFPSSRASSGRYRLKGATRCGLLSSYARSLALTSSLKITSAMSTGERLGRKGRWASERDERLGKVKKGMSEREERCRGGDNDIRQ